MTEKGELKVRGKVVATDPAIWTAFQRIANEAQGYRNAAGQCQEELAKLKK